MVSNGFFSHNRSNASAMSAFTSIAISLHLQGFLSPFVPIIAFLMKKSTFSSQFQFFLPHILYFMYLLTKSQFCTFQNISPQTSTRGCFPPEIRKWNFPRIYKLRNGRDPVIVKT